MKRITIFLFLLAATSGANAAIITWKISGVVTNGASGSLVNEIWGGSVSGGDSFEVLLSFDDSVAGIPSGGGGIDYAAIQTFQVTINGHTEIMTVDGLAGPNGFADEREISVTNDSTHIAGHIQDGYYISNVDRMESIYASGENRHEYLHVYWTDRRPLAEGSSMLDSTDLLSSPDSLSVANYSNTMSWGFSDFGTDPYSGVQISGNVLAVTVVPVPAAAWLFLSALGVLGWRRKKNVRVA